MNNRVMLLLGVLVFFAVMGYGRASCQIIQSYDSLPSTIKKVKRSIVFIRVGTNFPNIVKNASGFFIFPSGYIATCAHICDPEKYIDQNKYKDTVSVIPDTNNIFIKPLGSDQFLKARIVSIRPDRDVIILKVVQDSAAVKPLSFESLILGSVNDVEEGKEIATTGYDLAGQPVVAFGEQIFQITTHKGIISSFLDIGPSKEKFLNSFQVDLMVSRGASGSPIYDTKNGTVIGMICSVVGSVSNCIPSWVIGGMMYDIFKK